MSQTVEERLLIAIDTYERAKQGVPLDVPVLTLNELLALLYNIKGG